MFIFNMTTTRKHLDMYVELVFQKHSGIKPSWALAWFQWLPNDHASLLLKQCLRAIYLPARCNLPWYRLLTWWPLLFRLWHYLHCVEQLHKGQIRAALSDFQSVMPSTQATCSEVTNDGRESNLVPSCALGGAGTCETLAGVVGICFPSHSLENSVPSVFSHKHEILPKFILIYNYLGHTNWWKKKCGVWGLSFSGGAFWWPPTCCNCCSHCLPLGPVMRRAGGIAH